LHIFARLSPTIIPMSNSERQTGTVKFFNNEKGFGFIKHDNSNEETFVHKTGLIHDIAEGDTVSFELERGKKGMNAINVERV